MSGIPSSAQQVLADNLQRHTLEIRGTCPGGAFLGMDKPREPRPSEMLRGAHIAAARDGCPSRGIGHLPLKPPDMLPSAAASPLVHGMGRALIELSDGHRQPVIGFGTYKVGKLPPGTVEKKAKNKIDTLMARAEAERKKLQQYPVHFISTESFGTRYQKIAQMKEHTEAPATMAASAP